jgi:DNA-binding NtrC family response regulator
MTEREERTAVVPRRATPPPLAVLVRSTDGGASHRLGEGRCVVGSGPDADLVLRDPGVSRHHLEISLSPEGVRVRDLGSTNGTFYLGQRVEQMVLALGSRIELGATTLLLEPDRRSLEEGDLHPHESYHGLLGTSAVMRRLFTLLARLEGSLATVLVEGESGAGKELVARALHDASSVAQGPFVAVNCGALGRELVGSELFGHRRGAFTGAVASRKGAFETADGGTLFLDEVGELPLEVQAVLLRALETGEVRPLGEDRPRSVAVRTIAATHRDLAAEVGAGRFREDLYYRLAVVVLRVPPLRERREDIAPIALACARACGLEELPPEVIENLKTRSFPGNVRELRNVVQSYAALRVLPEGRPSAQPVGLDAAVKGAVSLERPYLEQRDALVEMFTRHYLAVLLERAGGNQTVAARLAGLDRTYLGRLLSRYQRR